MNAADTVQALEFACHRALRGPKDDMSRVMLLEALAGLKSTPLASFPQEALDLVERSREQADALSDCILASNSLSDPSIDHEDKGGVPHPRFSGSGDAPAERRQRRWGCGIPRTTCLGGLSSRCP